MVCLFVRACVVEVTKPLDQRFWEDEVALTVSSSSSIVYSFADLSKPQARMHIPNCTNKFKLHDPQAHTGRLFCRIRIPPDSRMKHVDPV